MLAVSPKAALANEGANSRSDAPTVGALAGAVKPLTIPFLLIALYFGAGLIALGLSIWVALFRPPTEQLRRVGDAVERAALSQLVRPALWTGGMMLLLGLIGAADALRQGGSPLWGGLLPPLAGLAAAAALFLGTRRIHRAGISAATEISSDQRAQVTARATVSSVLLAGATVGLVLLASHLFVAGATSVEQAQRITLLCGAAIAIVGLVVARAAVVSHWGRTRLEAPGPDSASLARLVGVSFHAPMLRLAAWMCGAALGHTTLIVSGSGLSAEAWLYPHLLPLVGLFSVLFGALVVRVAPDESPPTGWLRAGLVFFLLLVAGAWSMAAELPATLSRAVPAGLTFFFLGLLAMVALTPARAQAVKPSRLASSLRRQAATMTVLLLTLGLIVAADGTEQTALSSGLWSRLILAASVAVLPLMVTWSLASGVERCRGPALQLALIAEPTVVAPSTDEGRLQGAVPVTHLLVCAGALGVTGAANAPNQVLALSVGAAFGALCSAWHAGLAQAAREQLRTTLEPMMSDPSSRPAETLNLERAVGEASDAIVRQPLGWIGAFFLPTAVALTLHLTARPPVAWSACIGLALGVMLSGSIHAWLSVANRNDSERIAGLGTLVWALAQILLLFVSLSEITLSTTR